MKISSAKLGTLAAYITLGINIITGLIFTPWLIQRLGSSQYAVYALGISLLAYMTIDFGLSEVVARYAAHYIIDDDRGGLEKLLGITEKIYLVLGMIVFFGVAVFYNLIDFIYIKLSPEELASFKTVFLICGALAVTTIPEIPFNALYPAYDIIHVHRLSLLVYKLAFVFTTVAVIYTGGDAVRVILVYSALTFLLNWWRFYYIQHRYRLGLHFMRRSGVILAYPYLTFPPNRGRYHYIRRRYRFRLQIRHPDKPLLRQLFSVSAWMIVIVLADRFFHAFIPSLLGIFSSSAEITTFSIASTVEGYVFMLSTAMNAVFITRVVRMAEQKDGTAALTAFMTRIGRIMLMILSCVILGLIVFGKALITVWVGSEYIGAYYILVIILAPCLIHLSEVIALEAMYAMDMLKYRAICYAFGTVVSIAITSILAGPLGALGGGIGIGCAYILAYEIGMNVIYKYKMNLDIGRFFKNTHLKMLPPLCLSLTLGFVINRFIPGAGWPGLIIKLSIWAAAHLLILWFLCMNANEKKMIQELAAPILHRK